MHMYTISTPITIDSLVIRAWKTDPDYQYEVGKVIEVKEQTGEHPLYGDVRVQWQRGIVMSAALQSIKKAEANEV